MAEIRTKRVYEPAEGTDGTRVLVMRLWPRGVRKDRVDLWLKELGPIKPLLRAFLDKDVSWPDYQVKYAAGLERPEAQEALREVRALACKGTVTLLCGCANPERCHRTLLAAHLNS